MLYNERKVTKTEALNAASFPRRKSANSISQAAGVLQHRTVVTPLSYLQGGKPLGEQGPVFNTGVPAWSHNPAP